MNSDDEAAKLLKDIQEEFGRENGPRLHKMQELEQRRFDLALRKNNE